MKKLYSYFISFSLVLLCSTNAIQGMEKEVVIKLTPEQCEFLDTHPEYLGTLGGSNVTLKCGDSYRDVPQTQCSKEDADKMINKTLTDAQKNIIDIAVSIAAPLGFVSNIRSLAIINGLLSGNTLKKHTEYSKDDRSPFVKDPNAGTWYSACIADSLILTEGFGKYAYLFHSIGWDKHPNCPFTVNAHGDYSSILVQNKNIHPEGLSEYKMNKLQTEGSVELYDASELARLIKTAPNYKEGQHIHLFSCRNGGGEFAQQLADEMNVPVSAFTGLAAVNIFMFASLEFDNGLIPSLKEIKTFYPKGYSQDTSTDPYGYLGSIDEYKPKTETVHSTMPGISTSYYNSSLQTEERTTDSTSTSPKSTINSSGSSNIIRPEVITTKLPPLPGIDTSYYNSSLQPEELDKQLITAVRTGDLTNTEQLLQSIEQALQSGANIQTIDTTYCNFTPLHWATERGNIEVMNRLLSHGASINVKNAIGHTPRDNGSIIHPHMRTHFEELDKQLITAVRTGDLTNTEQLLQSIEQALQSGANIQTIDTTYYNFTPLHWATERGNIEVMNRLLSHGASINVKNAIGHTPRDNGSIIHPHMRTHFEELDRQLHDALVQAQKVGVVTKLLDAGASLTTPNANGYFPLNLAVMACDAEMVSYLLDKGAPVNQRTKNRSNITALEQVPHYGNKPGVANALLKAGAVSPKNTTTNPTPTNNAAPVVTKKTTRKLNLTKLAAANQAKAEAKAQAKAAKKEDKSLRRHVKHLKNIGYVDENMSTSQAVSLHKAGKLTYSGSVYVRDLKDAGYIDKNMPTSQAMNLLKEGKIGSGDAKTNNSDTNTSDGSGSGSRSYNLDNLDCRIGPGAISINGHRGTDWYCRTDSSLNYTYTNPATGKSWF